MADQLTCTLRDARCRPPNNRSPNVQLRHTQRRRRRLRLRQATSLKIDAKAAPMPRPRARSPSPVWVKPGTGKITVNGRDSPVYFARSVLRMLLNQFVVVNRLGQFDVNCTVIGGGSSGQGRRGAPRYPKALLAYEPGLRGQPRRALARDSRVVERKKYGKA